MRRRIFGNQLLGLRMLLDCRIQNVHFLNTSPYLEARVQSAQHRSLLLSLLTTGMLFGSPPAAGVLHSQTSETSAPSARALVLNGGRWHKDLDGVVWAARLELPLADGGRWLFMPGLTYAHYTLGSPTEIDVFVPEALVHLQLSRGPVRPYLGAGAGLSLINVIRTFDPVLSLATGLRIDVTHQWSARVEGDIRSFRFEEGTLGWSLGIARRF